MRKLLNLLVLLTLSGPAFSQMLVGTDTLYGNEWINYDQSYYKIPIAKDGLYRLDAATLQQAGIVLSELSGDRLSLYHMGQEIPIHLSSSGNLAGGDYLLFWGKQNRGEFDTHLFDDPAENQLNPLYSLVTDTSAYYLTWGNAASSTRMQTVSSDLTNPPPKEEWIWQQAGEVFTEKFMKNYTRRSGITIYFSHYDVAEGYGNRNINELLQSGNTSQDFSLDLPAAYIGGPNAHFTARFGVGEGEHRQIVQIDGGTYFERSYNDIAVKVPDFNFPLTDDDIDIHFEGQADDRDEQSIAFYQVDYPSMPDARNQKIFEFEVEASSTTKYLEIVDFNSTTGTPIIYDLTNGLRILCRYENGIVKAILPASAAQRSLVLLEEASAESLSVPQNITFPNLLSQSTEFLILTAPELREAYENQDQVQAYADYRASAAGGNYKTQIVEVEDLYHQFGYGLDRHPQSIRNFVHAAYRQWPNLKYVFIIGKGREYPSLRLSSGLTSAIEAETFFVPSFGFPASDNLMLSNNSSSVAVVPVGRIAATTPKEISIYLRKVETLEATVNNGQTIEERAWMKNIMHLGGGGNSGEQNAIKSNLERMAREVEGNLFGGKVTPFYKTSTDPIQQSRSQQIFDRINEGTAVITFFGHSSPGTFDFNIDNPDNYENFGKFPLIMSLGCYSGNFFTSSKGIAERFTFYEDKASVAFGASRGVGFISTLGGFADRFYEKMGGERYGQGIGDIISATRESFDYLTGLEIKTIVQQFSLMGDPSLRLHPSPGPDYVVDRSSVQFSPKVISIQEDSFQLEFEVLNLGQFIQDSITVDIRQKLPGGEELKVKSLRIATPAYASHHIVNLPTQGKASIGLNTFFIDIDVQNEVDELPAPSGEMNNSLVRADGQAGVNLFIVDNTASPVYPPKFALVGSAPVTLKSSTSDALAPERKYLLEIDTTHLFDSPLKERTEIVQRGGVIKWTPSLPLQDSTVYYWRISPDSTEAEIGYVWERSSFTYIEGSPNGWGQGHYGQFQENYFADLLIIDNGNFEFDINGFNITIRNKVNEVNDPPAYSFNLQTAAGSVRPWQFLESGIAVVVGDPITGSGRINPPGGLYGSVNPSQSRVFAFPTNSLEDRRNLINFLNDQIPEDSYVFLFSVMKDFQQDFQPEEWAQDSTTLGTNIFSVLEMQGATAVRQLEEQGALPYTLIYQKDRELLAEKIGQGQEDVIVTEVFIPVKNSSGEMKSISIGPAASWQSIHWKVDQPDTEADRAKLEIYGRNTNLPDAKLLANPISSTDTTLSFIDTNMYPFLELKLSLEDESLRSAPNLDFWHVLFDGLPDAALNPAESFTFENDTLQSGGAAKLRVVVENTSEIPMDSILVRFTLSDAANVQQIETIRFSPLLQDDSIHIFHEIPTGQLQGEYELLAEVNPEKDQPELFSFNNILRKKFFVQKDKLNPILDVTFDGEHILDGDLVSSQPEVLITLKDENRFVLLSDTSTFTLYLLEPGESSERRLYFSQDRIIFTPASSFQDNRAEILFHPILEEDGTYELIVRAKDIVGNPAGILDFRVSFEVINKRMISNVLNYPNPFSNATHFIYTLTGDRPPDLYKIQIMTVSGRLVKEIGVEEIGMLKIGTHRTEYAWDGKDEYGDQLANGVYLYQMVIQDNGEQIEHLSNNTDRFFRRNIGKLVILR